jgi:hypothetical protein
MTEKSYQEGVREAAEQVLDAFAQAQDFSLRATEAAVGLLPGDPPLRAAQKLPSLSEVVATSYYLAAKALDQQRQYALGMAEIVTRGAQSGPAKS